MRTRRPTPSPGIWTGAYPAIKGPALFAVLVIAGCATTSPGAGVDQTDRAVMAGSVEPEPQAVAPRPSPQPSASLETTPAAPTSPSSSISRQVLKRVIGLGAQQFIRLARVRAAFRGGRFFGWRVIAYNGPGPINPGDIVLKVNGRPIERPNQFMAVWNSLGQATEIVVALQRGGKLRTLRYPIID